MNKSIVVIGSSNTDLVIKSPEFPKPGETLLGGEFYQFAGGKGANQAVAAARLDGDVYFIANVGSDSYGKNSIQEFEKDGIHSDYIFKDKDAPSGVAIILINQKGQNSIVVAPGANGNLKPSNIDQAISALNKSEIVLMQLEIPMETVIYSIKLASKLGKKVIVNPAPAAILNEDLYKDIFLITPNETEASLMTGIQVVDEATASKAARVFIEKGVDNIIITLGEKGAFFKNKNIEFLKEACKVDVKDTTAAGDIFNGAIAVALAENKNWEDAIDFANKASAIGVSRMGAQASAPFRKELIA